MDAAFSLRSNFGLRTAQHEPLHGLSTFHRQ